VFTSSRSCVCVGGGGATPEVLAVLSILTCRAVQGTGDLRIRVLFTGHTELKGLGPNYSNDTWKLLKGFKKRVLYVWGLRVLGGNGCGLDGRGVGVRVPVGARFLFTPRSPGRFWGQPPIRWVPGALPPAVEQPGREADHSPPTSAKVKNSFCHD
jgi:hypothetical protein